MRLLSSILKALRPAPPKPAPPKADQRSEFELMKAKFEAEREQPP